MTAKNGESVALVFSNHVTREVFKIQGPVVANAQEAEANSSLIATAPELLEALERVIKADVTSEDIAFGYAAIAKAKGA
jgi:hypothetical protein